MQAFNPTYGQQINRGWGGGNTFLFVRLALVGVALGLSLIGACVAAVAN